MDKSKVYIRMCAAAREVQAQWRQQYGDFFADDSGRVQCWIPAHRQSERVKQGFGVRCIGDVVHLKRYVWLPRMDQLMELAQEAGRHFESITAEFHTWCKIPYPNSTSTPGKLFAGNVERVWLVFLMHKNYGKVWQGSEWVRSHYYKSPPQTRDF